MKQVTNLEYDSHLFDIQPGETILDALLRGGGNVHFSCRKGSCHTCLLKSSRGMVRMPDARGLDDTLVEKGYFLPCVAYADTDLAITTPDPGEMFFDALVIDKQILTPEVARLVIVPENDIRWLAGQFINIRHPGGAIRSYSIASTMESDDRIECHVRRIQRGIASTWLFDQVWAGDTLEIQGPLGTCTYDQVADPERPMLLVGTGTGLSPLLGVVREALARGHRGPIHLYHGSSRRAGLYAADVLTALESEYANFRHFRCCSGTDCTETPRAGRALDRAFEDHPEVGGFSVFLCGNADMVHAGRVKALLCGAERAHIHADPFENDDRYVPNDTAKMRLIEPNAELWDALDRGEGLRGILEAFYERVFQDPRLEPFFHGVTRQRAIDKQYEFLSDLFTGGGFYFGLLPFNAHHWMVISDELFDYREALFDECVRAHGIDEHLARYWRATHEMFRREIVKHRARGIFVDGVEHRVDGFVEETVHMDGLCDGCGGEIRVDEVATFHRGTGELFCDRCAAKPLEPD